MRPTCTAGASYSPGRPWPALLEGDGGVAGPSCIAVASAPVRQLFWECSSCNLASNRSQLHGGTLTENIPAVPPVPPYPQTPPYPPQGQHAPFAGNAPSYGAPQAYAPPYGQQPYLQPSQQPYPAYQQAPQPRYSPDGQWTYAGASNAPKSSWYRVGAGITSIVLGSWLFLQFLVGASLGLGILAFLSLVAAGGTVVSGIVLLAKQRSRGRGVAVTVLSFAGLALFVGFLHLAGRAGPGMFFFNFLLSVPVLVVMGIGLSRETRSA